MCAEKLLMFVIGKSNKPHCFKGIRSTPCRYRAQKKSWMTSELFEEWVRENDRKFALEGSKVALVADNCTAHPNTENLKSVTLYFSPQNTTSCLQPMDQGVIRSLKCKYRTNFINKVISAIDNGKQMPSISILEAMKILVYSWNEVSETTIINCFHKAGFKEGVGVSDKDEEYFPASKNSIDQLRQRDKDLVPEDFTYEDMLTIDDDVSVMGGVMTDEDIVQDIVEVVEEETLEEEGNKISDETVTKPTTEEVRKAIDTLVNFSMLTQSCDIGRVALNASKLFEKELCESLKQTSTLNFFRL